MKKFFKYVVVGLGVQGLKRSQFDKNNFVGYVDPYNKEAHYKYISDVPLEKYNAAFVCTPDNNKIKIVNYLLENKKHVLVEKPLFSKNSNLIKKLHFKAKNNKLILYTAYNHRFEPFIKKIKQLINKKIIGKIYLCNIFYGNGTSLLVKNSPWKDKSKGIILDIGSHLIDLCDYLFSVKNKKNFKLIDNLKFENSTPDYARFSYFYKKFQVNMEMTYCMWRNSFYLNLIGEKGSIHMNCLCKWGPSKLVIRKRKKPSGVPRSKNILIKMKDPTWKEEYMFFKKKVINKDYFKGKAKDIWINDVLNSLI
tara:strand:+ start:6913 stop:7836 length:924 start_codon:yes stop_codon:yes gene_type:complete